MLIGRLEEKLTLYLEPDIKNVFQHVGMLVISGGKSLVCYWVLNKVYV